jgi:Undecaprenyl-phosphate galactose phosphotransferase WbaP
MATQDDYLKNKNTDNICQPATVKYSLFQNNARAWMSFVLVFTDTIALLITILAAVNIRLGSLDYLGKFLYVDFLWIPILLLMVIYANFGLYPGVGISAAEEVRRLSVSTSLLFLIIITLTFLLKTTEIFSRIIIILAWLMALFVLPLARNFMRWLCVRLKMWGEPAAVVGFPDRRVVEVADFFVNFPQKGIAPKVIYVDGAVSPSKAIPYQILSAQNMGNSTHKSPIKTVLVVVSDWNWVGDNIDKYRYLFEKVILVQPQRANFSFSDSIALDFTGVMGFQVNHNLLNPWSILLKRLMDLTLSCLCLLVFSPLAAALSLMITFDSPGGIYYHQDRLGRDGKIVKVVKFRTMYINGDQIFEDKMKNDKELQAEWKKYQKLKSDPRITRVGAFIRKYSLDELPQLWNILYGQMSLVGPRPIMVSQKEMYGLAFHDYSQVRPGVTGLWQVNGRNDTTFNRRAELDVEYIQRWSIWLDLYIIFQTVKEVVGKHGAY